MKHLVLLAAVVLAGSTAFFASGCRTTERIVIVEVPRPTPTPRRTTPTYSQPTKAPISAPQNNPATFEAVTRPQSYSN